MNKTIEDILGDAGELLENAFVMGGIVDNTEQEVKKYINNKVKQIKQLIADEVIGEDEKDQEVTVMKMELTETYLEASTDALCYHARKKLREQQRKKLERL